MMIPPLLFVADDAGTNEKLFTLLPATATWILEIFNVYAVERPIKSLVYVQSI